MYYYHGLCYHNESEAITRQTQIREDKDKLTIQNKITSKKRLPPGYFLQGMPTTS